MAEGRRADGQAPGAHGPAAQVVLDAELDHGLGQHVRGRRHGRYQKHGRQGEEELAGGGQQQQGGPEGEDHAQIGEAAPADVPAQGREREAGGDAADGPRGVHQAEALGAPIEAFRHQLR